MTKSKREMKIEQNRKQKSNVIANEMKTKPREMKYENEIERSKEKNRKTK